MARPDYCPVGNEPCQSMCDEPCSWSGPRRRREDEALIKDLADALDSCSSVPHWPLFQPAITAARARLEKAP